MHLSRLSHPRPLLSIAWKRESVAMFPPLYEVETGT